MDEECCGVPEWCSKDDCELNQPPLKNRATIHISIPEEATDEQAEAFFEELVEEVGRWMEDNLDRGPWDAHLYMHGKSCEDSDHCYGPGSKAEKEIITKANREYERKISWDTEQMLRQRELHHFETEQENARLKGQAP